MIRDAGMSQRVMIQSFDWRTLALVQRLEPGMRTVYLTIESRNSNNVEDPAWTAGRIARDYASVPAMIKAAGGAIWAPNYNNIEAGSAQRAHDLGLQLVPWTVNEAADMRRLIDWGVEARACKGGAARRTARRLRRVSTTLPRYITSTSSRDVSTTARLCEMKT